MGEQRKTAEKVRELVEGVIVQQGYELVEVELANAPGQSVLRLYIDGESSGAGIGVDDCAKISRLMSDLLDVEDVIPTAYTLEVSSPGVFRPLRKPEHFDRVLGERVKVKTFAKLEGRKVFTGTLQARDGSSVSVDVDGTVYILELADVAKANLEPLL